MTAAAPRVYFPSDLGWRRPYVEIGEVWGAQGVVGRFTFEAPWEGGHRLIPRFETDVRTRRCSCR